MQRRCYAPWPAVALAVVAAAPTPAAANADRQPGASAARLESAGWHGRAIREPRRTVPPRANRWPAGWSAGAVGFGTGYLRKGGSDRVRSVQRMLRGLGYRPGPRDGRFGPRTAAATAWFQYKHGLPSTGAVNDRTLAVLRARSNGTELETRAGNDGPTRPERGRAGDDAPAGSEAGRAGDDAAPAVERRRARPDAGERPGPAGAQAPAPTDLTPFLLGLALLLWLVVMGVHLGRTRREPRGGARVPAPATRPLSDPRGPEPPAPVLGYVAVDRDELTDGVPPTVLPQLDAACERRGWSLVRVVHDVEPRSGRMSDRPGLFHALEVIASGAATALVVPRLRDLTSSVPDLGPLIRWFEEADARLVVLDVELDTHERAGRLTAEALAEVSEWERVRIAERTRNGLAATRQARRGTGREAVEDDPELAAWIQQMRAEGMSLQAIADTLNAHGVPTRRGGSRWRPSSVQTAAGYKRPTARRGAGQLPRPNGGDG